LSLTQADRRRHGLESDTAALRFPWRLPSVSLLLAHLIPFPSCCPYVPYSFPSLTFYSSLAVSLGHSSLPSSPLCGGSGGITPGKFFNTANARRCVLVHCLALKPVLYATVLCQCSCIFVNRRLLASRNIVPPFT
jgi:hypothetical protein